MLKRLVLAAALAAGLVPALAQSPFPPGPPPPVPALPDAERRTAYTITSSNCACNVGFQLYGDSTDYQSWIEVWLNGIQVQYNDPVYGWSIASPTGALSVIPRPITDAVLTFNNSQTGTVQIVSARRPRRLAEFSEGQGVSARALNQTFNDLYAINRDYWDKINDVTGRGFFYAPGNTTGPMPSAASCANAILGLDGTGLNPLCEQLVSSGSLTTPATTVNNDLATFNSTNGKSLGDSGIQASAVCTAANQLCASAPTILLPLGRVTLASGVSVMGPTSCGGVACTNESTVYYDCHVGRTVPYYNGSADSADFITNCEVGDPVPSTGTGVANANDVFDFWWVHGGANHLCHATNGSGAGWSGDTGGSTTARGTGYTQLIRGGSTGRGYITNANQITHCYNGSTDYGPISALQATFLSTCMTIGSSGAGKFSFTFGGSGSQGVASVFGCWNYYWRAGVAANSIDTSSGYNYTSSTIREAHGGTGMQAQFVIGVQEDPVTVGATARCGTAAVLNAICKIGLGFDSTTSFGVQPQETFANSAVSNTGGTAVNVPWNVGVGSHTASFNEAGDGTNSGNTFNVDGLSTFSFSGRF